MFVGEGIQTNLAPEWFIVVTFFSSALIIYTEHVVCFCSFFHCYLDRFSIACGWQMGPVEILWY